MRRHTYTYILTAALIALASSALAVPQFVNYQGRVVVDGTNYTGTGEFKMALLDDSGDVVWSNDGVSPVPAASVSLQVTKGLFSVGLGDDSLANMTLIPTSVVTNDTPLQLRLWFSDGGGFEQLSPDVAFGSVLHAFEAVSAQDASTLEGNSASAFATLAHSHSDAEVDDNITVSASGDVADGALSTNVSLLGQTIESSEVTDNSLNFIDFDDALDLDAVTTVDLGSFNMNFDLSDAGNLNFQDSGVNILQFANDGTLYHGDDMYWRDGNVAGTTLMFFNDDSNDGRLRIYENGIASVDLDANTQFVFNEQGLDRNFRIESDTDANVFRVDAGLDRVGIGDSAPAEKLTVAGNVAPTSDDAHDLGSSSLRWRDVYLASKIDFSSDLEFVSGSVTGLVIETDGDVVVGGILSGDGSGLTNLPADADGDPSNEIQTLSIIGSTVTLSGGGGSVDVPAGDITGVNAGSGLTGGGTNGDVSVHANVGNGLNVNVDTIKLGGSLTEATTVTLGSFAMNFELSSTGDLNIQDAGNTMTQFGDDGILYHGDDMYWRDGSVAGTTLMFFNDDGNDGRLRIYENGVASVDLDVNTQFVFNEQGLDRDFRIESDLDANALRVNAGLNNVGIGDSAPAEKFTVAGNVAPTTDDAHDLGTAALRWRDVYLASKIDSSSDLEFVSGSVTGLIIKTDGDVSVGGILSGDGSGLTNVTPMINSVTDTEILDESITALDLADNSVTEDEIAMDAVKTSEIAADAVTDSEIATGAVGSSEVQDDTLGFSDFRDIMTLDANTEINLGNSSLEFDLTGTGNLLIQDGGVAFASFFNNRDIIFDNNTFALDSSLSSIGIGTATPDGKLHVRQSAVADIFNLYDSSVNVLSVLDGGDTWIDSTTTFYVDASADSVGVGTASPTKELDVDGEVRVRTLPSMAGTELVADGSGNLGLLSSSARYKTAIRDLDADTDAMMELRPVRFAWKETGHEEVGLIAEEVAETIDDLARYNQDGQPEGVHYRMLSVYLLKAFQLQQENMDRLAAENVELQKRLDRLEKRL